MIVEHIHPHFRLEQAEQQLAYPELLGRVQRAAAGLHPNELVGLRLSKSIDYVVALLACWWAGAAYVPLDPTLPEPRLQAYLEAARPDRVLDRLPEGEPLPEPRPPGELAYVYCTSGSSGSPKAVEITHAGLVPMLREQIHHFDLQPGKRMLWLLSIQFDASLSDLGTALLSGATLVLPDQRPLPTQLKELKITHLDIPPALLQHYRPEEFPTSLETLIAGGEPADPARLREWARRYRLINVYGPTEATICTSLCRVDESWRAPRLGLPLAEMEHRVVDDELWIAGPGLLRRYRQPPHDPCVWRDGRRYYRTGDRVEALPDGDCLFLGRLDRQVKVRGHRIELDEVEAAARPNTTRCAAEVIDGELTLFYQGARPALDQLPQWMQPTRWVLLDPFPLTSSGKPDRPQLRQNRGSTLRCLDSLSSLQMAAELQAQGHDVTAVQLLKGSPLGMSSSELRGHLPPAVSLPPAPAWGRSVLLTGATGHLGSRLLQKFLAEGMRVYALTRRPLPPHPLLTVIEGDLTQPLKNLPEDVDAVFHCAAQVNTVLPWDSLRAANLDCLPQLLHYCAHGRPKAFHHASTLSVFVSSDFHGLARPSDRLQGEAVLYGGYAQTKWAAEAYLLQSEGVHIYRYGLLTADSRTGESGPRDFLRLFARGLLGLGGYPEGPEVYLDLTPIDYAVEATWACRQKGGVHHIAAPHRVSLRQLAAALELPPDKDFFHKHPQNPEQAAAQLALCRLHPDSAYFERNRSLDLFQRTDVEFEIVDLPFPQFDLRGALCTA